MDISHTLNERGNTHGQFKYNSQYSQSLKRVIQQTRNHGLFNDIQQEALDMICHKIARICAGDPNYDDHWRDIAGYAQLVVDAIHKDDDTISSSPDMILE